MPSINTLAYAFAFGAFSIITPGLGLPALDTNLAKRAKDVNQHEQSCHVKLNGLYVSSDVIIGEPYDSGSKCHGVYKALEKNCAITHFRCIDNGHGGTALYFDVFINSAGCVNPTLKEWFPDVNNFNCPDT